MMIFDQWWWLMLPGLFLGIYAQFKLKAAYGKYSQVPCGSGLTGAQAAREILDEAGLHDLPVREVPGHLTDHYDPIRKQLCLSSGNYHGRSLAAVGVAAHEAGHALQHKAAYGPLQLRMALVPVTQFASSAAIWLFIGGMFMNFAKLATLGIAIYGILALFQLVTLPVEFDASNRAKTQLLRMGLVYDRERAGIGKVLNAAALTYVAALVTTVMTLLHFMMIARGRD
jgi:uncharacterized protein